MLLMIIRLLIKERKLCLPLKRCMHVYLENFGICLIIVLRSIFLFSLKKCFDE
jgi:hypothetical protein